MVIAMVVIASLGFFLLSIGSVLSFWICMIEVGVFALLLFWHTHGRQTLARYIFFLFSICMTAVGSLLHGEDAGFDFFLFITALTPVLFFNKRWQYASLFIISMATYFIVKNLYTEIPAIHPIEKALVPYYLNVVIGTLIIYFGYGLFKSAHLEYEQRLQEKNKIIYQQKESLNDIKEQLEELLKLRTAKIKEQNNDFVKYAFLNSHKVRSPLARILGLINLTSFEDFSNEEKRAFYFSQIRNNVTELDDVLKEISTILNKNMEEE
ncbi:MAG: cell division protein FtsL [Marivirga sp.]|jgi:cell division protein FtsL